MDWNEYVANRDAKQSGAQKFQQIYEAWKQYYPLLSGAKIAAKIGIPVKAAENFMSQLNATEGNFEKAINRHRAYANRAHIRSVIRSKPGHPSISEIIEEEARLTKLIADLKTNGTQAQIKKPSVAPITGRNFFERTAKLDKQEPGLTAAQVAKRLDSTPDAIGNVRSWLRKAKGVDFRREVTRVSA